MKEESITIHNLDELHLFSCKLIGILEEGKRENAGIILLSGNLGAGKTAFAKELAACLRVDEEITSPTFVIQKEYRIHDEKSPFKKLIHIDAYRLEKKEELEYLGWNEIISDPENLILVEWPEQVEGIAIPHALHLNFEIRERETREIRWTEK